MSFRDMNEKFSVSRAVRPGSPEVEGGSGGVDGAGAGWP